MDRRLDRLEALRKELEGRKELASLRDPLGCFADVVALEMGDGSPGQLSALLRRKQWGTIKLTHGTLAAFLERHGLSMTIWEHVEKVYHLANSTSCAGPDVSPLEAVHCIEQHTLPDDIAYTALSLVMALRYVIDHLWTRCKGRVTKGVHSFQISQTSQQQTFACRQCRINTQNQ